MSAEIGILVGFFAFVMGAVTLLGYALVTRPAMDAARSVAPAAGLGAPNLTLLDEPSPVVRILKLVGEHAPASMAEAGALRKLLVAAGYRSPSAVSVFYGIQYTLMTVLGLAMGWVTYGSRTSWAAALVAALAGAGFGYTFAGRVLGARIKARRRRVYEGLPDALDLMVLCVEAGHSIDQAIIDASQEMKNAYPDLSGELALVHLELRAGKSRAEALRDLAERNGEPELRKLTNVLVQSDRFGTSMGPALRTHARYLRLRRRQQAEQAARKLSVKLIFPIFFLIFPSILLVTVGPAVLQLFTQLLPMMAGE